MYIPDLKPCATSLSGDKTEPNSCPFTDFFPVTLLSPEPHPVNASEHWKASISFHLAVFWLCQEGLRQDRGNLEGLEADCGPNMYVQTRKSERFTVPQGHRPSLQFTHDVCCSLLPQFLLILYLLGSLLVCLKSFCLFLGFTKRWTKNHTRQT